MARSEENEALQALSDHPLDPVNSDNLLWSVIAERDRQIEALRRMLERSNHRVMELEQSLAAQQQQMAERRRTIGDGEGQIGRLPAVATLSGEVHHEVGGAPGDSLVRILRSRVGSWGWRIYRNLPLSMALKMRCKGMIFRALAPVLRGTRSYRAWLTFEQGRQPQEPDTTASPTGLEPETPTKQVEGCSRVLTITLSDVDAARFFPPRLPDPIGPAPHQARILVIDEWVPTPDRSSGSFRLLEILKALRAIGCQVALGIHHGRDLHAAIAVPPSELARYESVVTDLAVTLFFGQAEILAHLAAEGQRYSHAWLVFPSIAREYLPWVRTLALHAKLIFDSVDLHHVRYARQAELTGDPGAARLADFYRRLETVCCRSSDLTIAITDEERRQLSALAPGSSIVVVPNIHPVVTPVAPISGRSGLLFIGGFYHQPNVDAVHYFVEEIFPRVRSRLPGIEFVILGSNMPPSVLGLAAPGVRPVGYVEDPAPYFHAARVFVAPLRYGAGMKGKVGQAMSAGLPSVATPIAAEGMDLEHERHVLVAGAPGEFADAVIRLCGDDVLWHHLSEQGRQHIEQRFSPAAVRAQLQSLLLV